MEGVNHLLQYPEYADMERLRDLLNIFESRERIGELVPLDAAESDGVNVFIGSENTVKVMDNSTLVFRKIRRGDNIIGAIGVIGPRRMDYPKVIATIDQLADRIDNMLNDRPEERPYLKG